MIADKMERQDLEEWESPPESPEEGPREEPQEEPGKEPGPRTPRLARILLALLVAIIIAAGGAALYFRSIIPDVPVTVFIEPGRLAFGSREALNILCLGIDENWTSRNLPYSRGARSDTMFIVRVDKSGRSLKVLSIPRDMRVYINEKYGHDKINAAHAFGGARLARDVVGRFLGITIDNCIVLKVRATARMIDALGGVDIDVEKDMDYDDNWGHLHIHLKKGPRHLTGEEAVGYARYRSDTEADRGRMRRQQQLVNALMAEVKKPKNLVRMKDLVQAFRANVQTDFRFAQLMDLAVLYRSFERSGIKAVTLPGENAFLHGTYYMVARENEKEAVAREFRDPSRVPVRLEVLNGTTTGGLAAEVSQRLKARGYIIGRVGNADSSRYKSTKIIDHTESRSAAAQLSRILGCGTVERGGAHGSADITVILGRDYALSR
jgi:LCP family protein required for cell wall assembly